MNTSVLLIISLAAAAALGIYFALKLFLIKRSLKQFFHLVSIGEYDEALDISFYEEAEQAASELCRKLEHAKDDLRSADSQRRMLDAMLRSLSDGVVVLNSAGIITLANRALVRAFMLHGRIEGMSMLETLRHQKLSQIFLEALESKDAVVEEIEAEHDGIVRNFIATALPVSSDDSESVIITLHDITRLKQLENMRRDFIANVSHEIKTPLTAIRGFSETLIDGAINDPDSAVRFLKLIKNHSERLNSLVEDLLTLSSIETGHINIERTDVDIEQIIDSVFMMLQDKASKKGLYLKKEIQEGTGRISADRDKFIQVVLNLVDNGIKYTEAGGVTAGIIAESGTKIFVVRDTGAGIPKEHLDRLGERFYRVDKARSRALGGTGLGLAIVKHIVRAHDWSMTVESELGKGTTIKIIMK
ncbi:MAG: PAS domain S-box protein [Nitrospirae bacterium]|nr:PAS domain S-box protein [Nitrospirota bacterium]